MSSKLKNSMQISTPQGLGIGLCGDFIFFSGIGQNTLAARIRGFREILKLNGRG
jgi:hypothetical protein